MKPLLENFRTIILANGAFPTHTTPLSYLQQAARIICCDGAIEGLLNTDIQPDYIVGDLDSLSDEMKETFAPILFHNPDQETNDLTKAVQFCLEHGWTEISILGATGKREDHTLGNLSLLADYGEIVRMQLLTDYGVFVPHYTTTDYESFAGQQVSIFNLNADVALSSEGLLYPIDERKFTSWWEGTLNEARGASFAISSTKGKCLVFREYPEE